MYAIAGVTGHVGSVAADTLLAQGKQVRVIVRDAAKGAAWRDKGAEVAVASLGDVAALAKAFAGVEGAFVLLPPVEKGTAKAPLDHNAEISTAIAAAVRSAKLPHVVFLSSVGAQHASGTGPIVGPHRTERDLAATGASITAIRAAYFQENWAAALGAVAEGVLPTFVPAGLRYAQVATADIGRTVAAALVEGGKPGIEIIELAGPRDYTAEDIAGALSRLIGKTITVQEAPLDAVVPAFASFGFSPAAAELYRGLYEGLIAGRVAFEGRRLVRGKVEVEQTLAQLLH